MRYFAFCLLLCIGCDCPRDRLQRNTRVGYVVDTQVVSGYRVTTYEDGTVWLDFDASICGFGMQPGMMSDLAAELQRQSSNMVAARAANKKAAQ